jgi:hypothetical protein
MFKVNKHLLHKDHVLLRCFGPFWSSKFSTSLSSGLNYTTSFYSLCREHELMEHSDTVSPQLLM